MNATKLAAILGLGMTSLLTYVIYAQVQPHYFNRNTEFVLPLPDPVGHRYTPLNAAMGHKPESVQMIVWLPDCNSCQIESLTDRIVSELLKKYPLALIVGNGEFQRIVSLFPSIREQEQSYIDATRGRPIMDSPVTSGVALINDFVVREFSPTGKQFLENTL